MKGRVSLLVGALCGLLVVACTGQPPFTLAASGPTVYSAAGQSCPGARGRAGHHQEPRRRRPADQSGRLRDARCAHRIYPANPTATAADARLVEVPPTMRGALPLPTVTLRNDDLLSGYVVFDVPAGVPSGRADLAPELTRTTRYLSRARRDARWRPSYARAACQSATASSFALQGSQPGGRARAKCSGYLGPNGAGKTTTIRLLLGLIGADGGQREIFGLDAQRERRRSTGAWRTCPGEVNLWPSLTGQRDAGLLGRVHGRVDAAYRDELIERFDFDPSKKVRAYSKGNRQKLEPDRRADDARRAAGPGRADQRPRPADGADVPRVHRGSASAAARRSSCRRTS